MQKAELVPVKITLGKAGRREYLESAMPLIWLWLWVKSAVMLLERHILLGLYCAGKFSPSQIGIKEQMPLMMTKSRHFQM